MTCDWPLPTSLEHLPAEWNTGRPECRDFAVSMASQSLELLTAGQVGTCPVTIRPDIHSGCGSHVGTHLGTFGVEVVNWGGSWHNGPVCSRETAEVALPAPVGRVDEVKVDGAVLDPSDYRIDSGYLLVWTGTGDSPFPHHQDVSKPDTDDGTMSVTYVNSYLPDHAGRFVMSVLAYEFFRLCSGKDCRLPNGVTNIVRQGLTMQITPGHWPDGKTGIREVDSWLARWNPRGMMSAPQVWSPDLPNHRTVGG